MGRDDCRQWSSAIYQYEYHDAVSAGFAVGSVKTKGDYRLLVLDVARTASVPDGDRIVTWGFGYRLLVEVENAEAAGSLTLPAIAASVELGRTNATLRLEIKGYTGADLWKVLPVPRPLNVDTHRDFLAAAEQVQKAFGDHPDNAVPVQLSAVPAESIAAGGVTQVEAREAVAVTMLLALAADGADQSTAARAVASYSDLDEADVDRLTQGLYLCLDGDGSGPGRVESASALLDPLRQGGWSLPRG
ncbi:MAG TPA: hypothetical protein VFQ85_05515 [Mycobacteriales bacterium]|nr:hypothetical protein [Mycobacteriales bacterium]